MASEIPYIAQPDPILTPPWSRYMISIYRDRKAPLLGQLTIDAIEEKAKETMKERMGECSISVAASIENAHTTPPFSQVPTTT